MTSQRDPSLKQRWWRGRYITKGRVASLRGGLQALLNAKHNSITMANALDVLTSQERARLHLALGNIKMVYNSWDRRNEESWKIFEEKEKKKC